MNEVRNNEKTRKLCNSFGFIYDLNLSMKVDNLKIIMVMCILRN